MSYFIGCFALDKLGLLSLWGDQGIVLGGA
jgi:hypothetical protein